MINNEDSFAIAEAAGSNSEESIQMADQEETQRRPLEILEAAAALPAPTLNFDNSLCHMCNGFYGPSFDDPLCATCHVFLYPPAPVDITCVYNQADKMTPLGDSDSSDSGNDEPMECQAFDGACGDGRRRRIPPIRVDNLPHELQRLSIGEEHCTANIELLPTEVLLMIFQYMDDISIWSIASTCKRWYDIVMWTVKQEDWARYVRIRWPLLRVQENPDNDWFEIYSSMMLSSCCFKCVKQMGACKLPGNVDDSSWRRHRLRTELKAIKQDPLDGIDAVPLDKQLCYHWQATIEGPAGSPYEGGLFFLYIQVPNSYPLHPPIVRFITRIFHPNVSRHGDIGIDSIQHNWSLALTINKLLISIQSLLTDPFCDVCMEPSVAQLYMTDRQKFEDEARLWTARYALNDLLPSRTFFRN